MERIPIKQPVYGDRVTAKVSKSETIQALEIVCQIWQSWLHFFVKQPQWYDYEIVLHGKNQPFVLCSRIDWPSILLEAAFGQMDLSHLNQRDDLKTIFAEFRKHLWACWPLRCQTSQELSQ